MSGQHTPGPWNCSASDGWIGDDEGNKVACYCDDDGLPLPNADADKHLIAAAPDLLAALEHGCSILSVFEGSETAQGHLLRGFRAAIAKAKASA